jgi:hypothetical protein
VNASTVGTYSTEHNSRRSEQIFVMKAGDTVAAIDGIFAIWAHGRRWKE